MFRNALEKDPGNVVALCGLASALLGRARQCTAAGALAWAATLLQVFLCAVFLRIGCTFLVIYDGRKHVKFIFSCDEIFLLLQEAADVAEQCTKTDGTVAAGWKLLGDIEVPKFCAGKLLPVVPYMFIRRNYTLTGSRVGVKSIMITIPFMASVSHAYIELD